MQDRERHYREGKLVRHPKRKLQIAIKVGCGMSLVADEAKKMKAEQE
jgi:hypothetical protein